MPGHIFISYSSMDREYAHRLATYLQSFGLDVWYDPNIQAGERFSKVIEAALAASVAVVVVMTPQADASEWVERETQYAEDHGKPVLPVLLSGNPFFRYRTSQWHDVRGDRLPAPAFAEQLRRLTLGGVPVKRVDPAPPRPAQEPVTARASSRRKVAVSVLAFLVVAAIIGAVVERLGQEPRDTSASRDEQSAGAVLPATHGSTPSTPAPTTQPTTPGPVERLAKAASISYQDGTYTVTSVLAEPDRTVVTMQAENKGDQPLEIWDCCSMVTQPGGQSRRADPFSGTFPVNPLSPIPAGNTVAGTVVFAGGLDPDARMLVVVLRLDSGGFDGIVNVQIDDIKLTAAG